MFCLYVLTAIIQLPTLHNYIHHHHICATAATTYIPPSYSEITCCRCSMYATWIQKGCKNCTPLAAESKAMSCVWCRKNSQQLLPNLRCCRNGMKVITNSQLQKEINIGFVSVTIQGKLDKISLKLFDLI